MAESLTQFRRRLRMGRGLQDHFAAVSRRAFFQPGDLPIVEAPPPASQDGNAGIVSERSNDC
jgi:hypothetical protein